jgi:hypothetical protein
MGHGAKTLTPDVVKVGKDYGEVLFKVVPNKTATVVILAVLFQAVDALMMGRILTVSYSGAGV